MKNNVTIQTLCCYLIGLTSEKDIPLLADTAFKHSGKTGSLYLPPPNPPDAEIHESVATALSHTFLM